MKKNTFVITIMLLLLRQVSFAQNVGIGTTTPDASAILELNSNSRGLLIPRMDSNVRKAIVNPAKGLMVFDNEYGSFWFFDGTSWENIEGSATNQMLSISNDTLFLQNGGYAVLPSGTDSQALTLSGDTLSIQNGNSIILPADTMTLLADADRNTKIQVEESPNEDIIRFDMGGTEYFRMDSGRLEVVNTGGNVFIGNNAGLSSYFNGNQNVGIGESALKDGQSTYQSVAIGYHALSKSLANDNTAAGFKAMENATNAYENSAFGSQVLADNVNGVANSAFGNLSQRYSTANNNSSFGDHSLYNNTTGANNAGFGMEALGSNTTGTYNTAVGYFADVASGNLTNATAIGANTTVAKSNSIVLGYNANVGIGTSAPDTTFHLVGKMKYQDGTQGSGYILTSDNAGNATWASASSLAIKTVFDTLGGVVIPGSAVNATTNDFVFGSPQLDDDGNASHDSRFFFDKSKGAFRAGKVLSTNWDADSIGTNSVAMGYNTKANGNVSVALGYFTEASGDYSTAIGNQAEASGTNATAIGFRASASENSSTAIGFQDTASGSYATAMGREALANGYVATALGYQTTAGGNYSTALGSSTTASGISSTAMGDNAMASGNDATAIGYGTTASGNTSTAMGRNTKAIGDFSTSMGYQTTAGGDNATAMGTATTASGSYATAMGNNTKAPSGYETVIGRYNTTYTPADSTAGWNPNDRLFSIGKGTSNTNRSDAMVVLKNGKTGIGISTPDATFHLVGQLKYQDGTQGSGYILTSDSAGKATWKSFYAPAVFDTSGGVVIPGIAVNANTNDFVFGSTQLDDDGNVNHDSRFFFDKSKGAFRAGQVPGANWDADSLGTNSMAMGYDTKASGNNSVALGYLTEASGDKSTTMGNNTTASGDKSAAMGNNTTASGNIATAIGNSTSASGTASTAMGSATIASGNTSTAMGTATTASGDYSTAMGNNTTAPSGFETTIGRFSTTYTPTSPTGWVTNDRLFTIGNGTASSNRSDAMVVLKNGNTGVGTSAPDTTFHLIGKMKYQDGTQANGYVLTSDVAGNASWTSASLLAVKTAFDTLNGVVVPGSIVSDYDNFVFGSPQLDYDGIANHSKRFFFDKGKGAFRAGQAPSKNWDADSIGNNSIALGYDTKSIGDFSTAMGYVSTASGERSTAMGNEATASGYSSTAMGRETIASGGASTAMGNGTTASGGASTAMGIQTTASGDYSTAIGRQSTASGIYSTAVGNLVAAGGNYAIAMGNQTTAAGSNATAMGYQTTASGTYSTAMGYQTTASGSYATAMGKNTSAPSGYETTIGHYNTAYTPADTTGWNADDRLFTIGKGTSTINRSDAMVVLKNGNTGIGTSAPDTTFHLVGKMKYQDGTQTDGYVLTSDANGNASWKDVNTLTDTMSIIANAAQSTTVRTSNDNTIRFTLGGVENFKMSYNTFQLVSGIPNYGSNLGISFADGSNTSSIVGVSPSILSSPTDDQYQLNFSVKNHPVLELHGDSSAYFTGNVGIGKDSPDEKLDVAGNVRINNNDMYLRDGSDVNHGVGWYGSGKTWAGVSPDGPVVYGYSGGVLGTTNGGQKSVLTWNKNGQVTLGSTGTAINGIIKATVNYNIPQLGANDNEYASFTITGAQVGATVFVSPSQKLQAGIGIMYARVTAADTVEVKFTNTCYNNCAENPPPMDFYVTVIN